ncbi:MAG: NYN domain-containing protein [Lachnospiraceae bacterium]|nr:NYN domain-containing protein [Lachnospiraceae bacterium]
MNNSFDKTNYKHNISTAILVDGGFYRKRAKNLWGELDPKARSKELYHYCMLHLRDNYENRYLYRIFYYDCPPIDKNIYNPITKKTIKLKDSEAYIWMNSFLSELKHQRKLALRLGNINDNQLAYHFTADATKRLLSGSLNIDDASMHDMELHMEQKGVDMRIGVDIASLSFKKQVNQIILISGDSDFVPAAKQARREGIDFILDPMRSTIRPDLYEHIDGIRTPSVKNRFAH